MDPTPRRCNATHVPAEDCRFVFDPEEKEKKKKKKEKKRSGRGSFFDEAKKGEAADPFPPPMS